MNNRTRMFAFIFLICFVCCPIIGAQEYETKVLELTIETTDTTEGGEDEVFFTVRDAKGKETRVPSTGTHPMNEDSDIEKWVTTTDISVYKPFALPINIFVFEEDDTSADDMIALVTLMSNQPGTMKGIDGYTINWKIVDKKNTGKTETYTPEPKTPRQAKAAVTADRLAGRTFFKRVTKDIFFDKIGTQQPWMKLVMTPTIATYAGDKYLMMDMKDTTVAASSSAKLQFDRPDLRGWYLEYVEVSLEPKTKGFELPSYGPRTTAGSGSVTTSSGVSLGTGVGVGLDGGKPQAGASVSAGLDFSTSYSANLTDFSVLDKTVGKKMATRYHLSATNPSETWSNPKGGEAPYSNSNDLIRIDAAGQIGGTPLNYLPNLAIGNFPIISVGTWKAPDGFTGVARFELKVKMHLVMVQKTNSVFVVDRDTQTKDINLTRNFDISFRPVK